MLNRWTSMAVAALLAGAPWADSQAQESPAAQLARGLADLRAGRVEAGCDTVSQTHAAHPSLATLAAMGDCAARQGKPASASSLYRQYLEQLNKEPPAIQAKEAARRKSVSAAKDAADAQTPVVTFTLPQTLPQGVSIRHDGNPLPLDQVSAIPVDPGDHTIVLLVPDAQSRQLSYTIAVGDSKTVDLSQLFSPPPPASASAPPAVEPSDPDALLAESLVASKPRPAPPSSSKRNIGLVVTSVGAAALGVGIYFGAKAFSKWDDAQHACVPQGCSSHAVDSQKDASRYATIANIGVGVGIAGIAVGTYLVLSNLQSPPSQAARNNITAPRAALHWTPLVGSHGPAMAVGGVW